MGYLNGNRLTVILFIASVIIGFFFWYFPHRESYDAVLKPDNADNPKNPPCINNIPSDALKIFIGGNVIWTNGNNRVPILTIGDREIISLKLSPEGILISGLLYDLNGHQGVIIEDN